MKIFEISNFIVYPIANFSTPTTIFIFTLTITCMCLLLSVWTRCWTNCRITGDLRRLKLNAVYDVTVISKVSLTKMVCPLIIILLQCLLFNMMTSSNGNIFCVTGPLCGEFTGHRWIPLTKVSDAQRRCFLMISVWTNGWVNNRDAGDFRRHRAHYDITVMNSWNPGLPTDRP